MDRRLAKKLRPFFMAKTTGVSAPLSPAAEGDRYWPRAYRQGPGWGVYDKQEQRFLSDREVMAISEDVLMNAKVLQ